VRAEPHLTFDGRCEEAFRFYERVFDGRLDAVMRYGDSPIDVPADARSRIVHATLTLPGGARILGADVLPGQFQRPQGIYLFIAMRTVADAARVFGELATGGSTPMPLQKTFWSPCFGVVIDRFGIGWEVSID